MLITDSFAAELKVSEAYVQETKLDNKIESSKQMAAAGTTTGASAAIGLGLLNFDPSSIFDFLNTAEMFYSVYLFNFSLNPILSEFLIGLRIQKSIPNVLNMIEGLPKDHEVPAKLKKFGYKSTFCLINIGIQLTTLCAIFVVWLLVYFLAKISKFKGILGSVYDHLTYGIFLRFWLQTFLEVLISAGLAFVYLCTDDSIDAVELSFSSFLIVICI